MKTIKIISTISITATYGGHMAKYKKTKSTSYGFSDPLVENYPKPVISSRSPTTADIGHEIGQIWINQTTSAVLILTVVSAGSATWTTIS